MSCRFTTGAIRVGDGTHVVLPRIGRVKTHERTAALLARVAAGAARILAATVSFDGRRWQCAFTVEVAARTWPAPRMLGLDRAHPVIGVDLGVRDLLVAAAPDGAEVARVPAPRSLAAAQARLRALQRRAARQVGPDRRTGQRPSQPVAAHPGADRALHARAADLRRDALHKATTALAQRHQVIVVEDLAVAGMSRRKPGAGRGGRGLNRALADAAPAELRRQLGYKTTWYGSRLCGGGPVVSQLEDLLGLRRGESQARPGRADLDSVRAAAPCTTATVNAAINLARLSEHALGVESRPAGSGPVAGRGASRKTSPPRGGAGGDEASTPRSGHPPPNKTGTAPPQGEAA